MARASWLVVALRMVSALSISSLGLCLHGSPSLAMMNEDGDSCVRGNGSAEVRLAACNRALDYWLLSSQERYNILEFRVDILLGMDHYQQAVDDLIILLRKYPDWDSGYNLRCIALKELKNYEKAIADCTRAISISNDYPAPYFNRAIIYMRQKNYSEAMVDWNSYIKLKSNATDISTARAYRYRGESELILNNKNDALKDFERSAIIDNSAKNLNGIGYTLAQSGLYDEARKYISSSLSKDGGNGDTWDSKGYVDLKQNRFAEAVAAYDTAIQIIEKNDKVPPITYAGRAEAREKLGDLLGAKSDFEAALQIDPNYQWAKEGLERIGKVASSAQRVEDNVSSSSQQSSAAGSVNAPKSDPEQPPPQAIRQLQTALAALGFDVGKPDGQIGRRTATAVAAYKRSAKLPAEAPLDEAFVAGVEKAAEAHADAVAAANVEAAKQVEARRVEAERQRQAAEAAIRQARAEAAAEAERQAEARRQQEAQAALAAAKAPAPKVEIEIVAPGPPAQAEAPDAPAATMAAATPPLQMTMPQAVPSATVPDPHRIALVIGNSGYLHAPSLPNPRNDADDVAALLGRMGFTVVSATDLDRNAMEDAMIRFAKAAAKAEIAVTYYAGHGLQVDGTNYLVPIDADIEDELDLRRLIRLDDMVRDTGRAERFGFVMVDACRDNPFEAALSRSLAGASRSTGLSRGLAAPTVPARVLVTFATAATQTAADGRGRNSPFAAGVLQHLAEPDDIRIVVGRIVDAVAEATQQRQRPDMWGSLGGERILLVKPEAVAEALDAQLTPPERAAVLSALTRLGMYSGPLDGAFNPSARRAIRDFQVRLGAIPTGSLTIEQMVALYDQGRLGGSVEPLPPVDIVDLLRRSEAGAPDAELLWAKVFDRNYEAGPLPKDMSEAARWYRKAAEAGDAEAALALGLLLQDGDGVELDLGEARRWLAAAAKAGNTEAQYRLALLYLDETDPGADRSEAIRLLKQAAQSSSGEAIGHLRQLKAWAPP